MRWYRSLRSFIRDATAEMKKVIWPTADELKAHTSLVLFVLVVVAAWFGILGWALHFAAMKVNLYGP